MTGKLNPVLLLSKVELIQVKPESIHKNRQKNNNSMKSGRLSEII